MQIEVQTVSHEKENEPPPAKKMKITPTTQQCRPEAQTEELGELPELTIDQAAVNKDCFQIYLDLLPDP